MNITEATHVTKLLRLLDGSYTGRDADQIVETVAFLRDRCEKPLQVIINLDVAETRAMVVDRFRILDAPEQPPMAQCPRCKGAGETYWNHTADPAQERHARCHVCGGAGEIDARHLDDDAEVVETVELVGEVL